jgi:hypothetical protein
MTAFAEEARREPASAWLGLPDEVLQHILFYVSPSDLLSNVQCTSKRFCRLASEPLLWRHHCRVRFTYWDSKHRIRQKFTGNVGDVDWKTLYMHRKRVEAETATILDSIIEGQVDRIQKFKMIADFGYDAKDTLLNHCRVSETAEDVLARRQAIFLICSKLRSNVHPLDIMRTLFSTTFIVLKLWPSGRSCCGANLCPSKEHWDHSTSLSCTTSMEIFSR